MNAFARSKMLFARLRRLARSYVECFMLSSDTWPQSLGIQGVPIRFRLRMQKMKKIEMHKGIVTMVESHKL